MQAPNHAQPRTLTDLSCSAVANVSSCPGSKILNEPSAGKVIALTCCLWPWFTDVGTRPRGVQQLGAGQHIYPSERCVLNTPLDVGPFRNVWLLVGHVNWWIWSHWSILRPTNSQAGLPNFCRRQWLNVLVVPSLTRWILAWLIEAEWSSTNLATWPLISPSKRNHFPSLPMIENKMLFLPQELQQWGDLPQVFHHFNRLSHFSGSLAAFLVPGINHRNCHWKLVPINWKLNQIGCPCLRYRSLCSLIQDFT